MTLFRITGVPSWASLSVDVFQFRYVRRMGGLFIRVESEFAL